MIRHRSNTSHYILLRKSFYIGCASFVITLSGCGSLLSSSGPTSQAIKSASSAEYTFVNLSADTIRDYIKEKPKDIGSSVAPLEIPEIRLVPGDVIRVLITDTLGENSIFAPLSSGGTVFEQVRIDSQGRISLPYVGSQRVANLSLGETESVLKRKLGSITQDVQVNVSLTGDLSGSVLVAGAVKSPGRFSALQGPLTIVDAINRAGGATVDPHLITVVVRTRKRVEQFNYEDLLAGKNSVVTPGAEIVLEKAKKRFVAMGAVNDPGLHDLPSSNPSLLEVLGSVKGLNDTKADSAGVFIFRAVEDKTPGVKPPAIKALVFRLDLHDPASIFIAKQFVIEPEDAVYVTSAAVYEWQKIISPIVQVLVLGRIVNAGF